MHSQFAGTKEITNSSVYMFLFLFAHSIAPIILRHYSYVSTTTSVNMATKKDKEKEPINIVHQNAIFCETVRKEQRHQKLYTNYGLNPYKKSKRPTTPISYIIFFFFLQCILFQASLTHYMTPAMARKTVCIIAKTSNNNNKEFSCLQSFLCSRIRRHIKRHKKNGSTQLPKRRKSDGLRRR